MSHIFGLLLFLMALGLHEVGHAIAMWRRGVKIKEVCLGLKITGKFKLTWRPRFLPFPVYFTPVPFGAYVMPTDKGQERLEGMSYQDKASCYGAGVIVNILIAGALLCPFLVYALTQPDYPHKRVLLTLLVALAVMVVAVVFRRQVSWILPVLGLGVVGLVVYSFITMSTKAVSGPIGVVTMSTEASTWWGAILNGSSISLGLGLFNMIPLVPLDGGHVALEALKSLKVKRVDKFYAPVTFGLFTGFIAFAILMDVFHLLFKF